MVIEYIDRLGVTKTENRYLHFARMDKVDSLDPIEGVLFLATPDILSGLVTWACYDNNSEDAVVTQFRFRLQRYSDTDYSGESQGRQKNFYSVS